MIAIYVRESTPRQYEKGFNFETQKEKSLQFLDLYDIDEEYKFYLEKGKSAWTTNRPVLKELMQDIVDGKITTLVIYKLDRLLRRHKGKEEILSLLEEYNVTLMSVSEKIDTSSSYGKLILNMMVSYSEWEEDVNSERTNDGLTMGAELGYFMNGGRCPFGWERYTVGNHKKIKVNRAEKEVIHKMAEYIHNGYSTYQVKMLINENEYLKSINKTFCENQIINILKDKKNVGIYEYKGKEYVLEGETIFTEAEYKQVQNDLAERPYTGRYSYLFDHKVRSIKGAKARLECSVKKDKVYLYYFDNQSKKRISESMVKKQFIKYMKESNLLYIQKRTKSRSADIRHIAALRRQLKNMYENMELTTEVYFEEMRKLDKEQRSADNYYKRYVQEFDIWFNSLDYDQQVKIIWQNIKCIEVDFETKELRFNS